jgi:hypothetical protein
VDVLRNLRSGVNLWRPGAACEHPLRLAPEQVAWLAVLNVLVFAVCQWLGTPGPVEWSAFGLSAAGFHLCGLLAAALLVARWQREPRCRLLIPILVLCALPVVRIGLLGFELLAQSPGFHHARLLRALAHGGAALAVGVVVLRGICMFSGISRRDGARAASFILILGLLPSWLGVDAPFVAQRERSHEEEPAAPHPAELVNAEELFYAQPERVRAQNQALRPGRRGIADLYFVAFGAWAEQDVFRKEVLFARERFEQRLGAAGRSAVLLNSADTHEQMPIASVSNLRLTLERIGELMNRDEDVLFLFLTSHGSRKRGLSVSFGDLELNDLKPQTLASILADSGIRWRVIVVSSCYSGSFVKPLQDPHTLIATAAAHNRKSFGCSDDADFTYFGRALLADQLGSAPSFLQAFESAREAIALREQEEHKRASQPQLWYGSEILPKLAEVEARFAHPTPVAPRP